MGSWFVLVASQVKGVVPVAVETVPVHGQSVDIAIGDLDAGVVGAWVEFGVDGQPVAGCGRRDTVHDDVVADQRAAAPVHGDVGEQPVLDLVPLQVPGGLWQTVKSQPVSTAKAAS